MGCGHERRGIVQTAPAGRPWLLPVLAIDDAQASDQQGKSGKIPLSKGVARGIRTGKAGDALTNAMEKRQFKAALKSRMSKAE